MLFEWRKNFNFLLLDPKSLLESLRVFKKNHNLQICQTVVFYRIKKFYSVVIKKPE
jgi:hypothetical protein